MADVCRVERMTVAVPAAQGLRNASHNDTSRRVVRLSSIVRA